ncbi:MAG: hypothetical protein ACC645_21025 [Pirellulales bacterium]
MPTDQTSDSTPQSSVTLPPEGLRTLVSFLLFFHLFALSVAVAANARPVSRLRNSLLQIPGVRAYLDLLNMDLAYNFHLTHATELDTDHFVEIELDWNGKTDPKARRIVLPEPGMRPGIRKRRFRNLARVMAAVVGEDDVESLLPHAVARGLLASNGIDQGHHRFRCRRHFLLQAKDVQSIDPAAHDPFHSSRYGTAYEADLIVSQGELSIIKAAGAAETAPAERKP